MHLRAAVRALLAIGVLVLAPVARAEDAGALVLEALSGSAAASDRAIERLRYLGPDRAGPPLRQALKSEDAHHRAVAASALGIVRDQSAASALTRALEDADWLVRRNAAQSLGLLRVRQAARPLDQLVRTEPHVRVRRAAVGALAQVNGTSGLVWAGVHDTDLEVRLSALDTLARSLDTGTATKLRPLLQDGSGLVRFAAARALCWLGDGAGRAFLEGRLANGELEERRRAALALSDVPKGWAVALLVKSLVQQDPTLVREAAVALAKRGEKSGLRRLSRLAISGGAEAAEAERALDQLGVSASERTALALEDQ